MLLAPLPEGRSSLAEKAIKKKRFLSIALLLLVGTIVTARRPELLISPRFWAEEGEVYFSAAIRNGFWKALSLEHIGYYNIVPNIATAMAVLVPLELAPFVTTFTAFLCQVLTSAVAIFGKSRFWDTWPKKLIIACGIQLITPFELWLTSLNAHFWFCTATFFILLEPIDQNNRIRWFHRVILVFAGLSSVVSVFLTPLFLLKAWQSKLRESWIQTGILMAAGLLQVSVFFSALFAHDAQLASRFGNNQFALRHLVLFHFMEPFWGWPITDWVPLGCILIVTICLMLFLLVLFFRRRSEGEMVIIFLSFFSVAIFSTLLSFNMASASRYAFAPSVMTLVVLVDEAFKRKQDVSRWLATFFIFLIALSCLAGFRSRIFYSSELPRWREEVAAWRLDNSKPLKIWPQFRFRTWQVVVPPKDSR